MNPVFVVEIAGWSIPDTVFVSAGLTVLLVLVAVVTSRRLRTHGLSRWQTTLETYTEWIRDTVGGLFGEDPTPYVPLIGTLILFIAVCNMMSLVPVIRPPTADLSATVALAGVVMFAVPYYGIRRHGVMGYLRTYVRPHPLLLPLNLVGELTRTLALAVRLFGNMMSAHLIGAVLLLVAGVLVPIPILALGVLTGLIQAYIFGILAAVYIAAAVAVDTRRQQESRHG